MNWTVQSTPRFRRDHSALPTEVQQRINSALRKFAENPFDVTIRKMAGSAGTYRVRVGDYRIVVELEIAERTAYLLRVGHHRDVYR